MKRFCAIVFMLIALNVLHAQEFRATISVNYQKLMNTSQSYATNDTKVFETMKQSIEDFVNGRRWTNLDFQDEERLEVAFGITLTRRNSATEYEGQLNVQLRRPVYNSNYSTGLFNYVENSGFVFTFDETQPLEYDPTTFSSNLTSTLAYYLYMMLGMSFDSYGLGGGMPFYEQASNIAQQASASPYQGWDASGNNKARYWFSENHTNSAYQAIHSVYYNYHRMGLDRMTQNQEEARVKIIQALQTLAELNTIKRNMLTVTTFVDMKIDELVSIFTPASATEQQQVYDAIRAIAPVNVNKLTGWNVKKK
ncbi:MAG: DUF4835 family protein [Bacteroidales bacterium]|nr:DUF4835 family protein [Bacteroidales bacterium]